MQNSGNLTRLSEICSESIASLDRLWWELRKMGLTSSYYNHFVRNKLDEELVYLSRRLEHLRVSSTSSAASSPSSTPRKLSSPEISLTCAPSSSAFPPDASTPPTPSPTPSPSCPVGCSTTESAL